MWCKTFLQTAAVRVAPVELTARIVTLRLAETFVISRESSDEDDVVQVELSHDGVTGCGEGAPIERYDESGQSALAYLEAASADLGDDPFALEQIEARLPPGENAARAALDGALHDLQAKLLGVPVWKLLGLPRTGPPTSWTVWLGDPDDMARRAEKAAPRFRRLKLKLGGGDGLDVDRVRAVRRVTELPLQVDVNEWWSLEEALDALPQLQELGVAVLRAAAPRRRRGRADVEGSARRSRSTSTRTATGSTASPPAPRSRTGSTSSWRSRAGSARRSGWRTPPVRSASGSWSAA